MTIDEEPARQRRFRPKPDQAPRSDLTPLVLAARVGDGRAWEALVARFTPVIRAAVYGYRLDSAEVEDVVQTAWLRAFTQLGHLREPEAVAGWLLVTARREALAALRRRSREIPVDMSGEAEQDAHSSPEGTLLADEQRAVVRAAVERLPERQRAVVRALNGGAACADLARRLNMPVGSIGPTRERAFARLRRDGQLAALRVAA